MIYKFAAALSLILLAACDGAPKSSTDASAKSDDAVVITTIGVDDIAERFVKLGLALGEYDKAYVDAYHGPVEWADAAKLNTSSLEALRQESEALLEALSVLSRAGAGAREHLLKKQIIAANARIRMAQGETFAFDEETKLIYDSVVPQYDVAEFDAALAEVDALLPGTGSLEERAEAFTDSFIIPADKLQTVMDAAITECRRRTLAHYELPETEKFSMRVVTDKPWGGYNWYQGAYESVIEINIDLPSGIDRAVDLGCHEGYPGHHVWSIFVERDFLRKNGWIEYALYPLFSPQSLIAEGSANYGIELAFPGDERLRFERDVLFPLTGLDPERAEILDSFRTAKRKLAHARNHVARAYLDGEMDRESAVTMLMKYSLNTRERAEKQVDFIDTYRGYVINYNLGQDLVAQYVEKAIASGIDPWDAFEMLLTTPSAAGDLIEQ